MLNIAATKYNLSEKSLELYVSGCDGGKEGHCPGCHNPELWNSNHGSSFYKVMSEVENQIKDAPAMIDSLRIYGGELLEKSEEEIEDFLRLVYYNSTIERDPEQRRSIWLFTRFEFEDVPEYVLEYVDYVKCGRYDNTQLGENLQKGVMLASLNQKIYQKGVEY